MKKSAIRMASTTSDTGDISSKQQQAQRKENYNKVRGPFHQSITAILTEEKREEKQFTKPTHVAVNLLFAHTVILRIFGVVLSSVLLKLNRRQHHGHRN